VRISLRRYNPKFVKIINAARRDSGQHPHNQSDSPKSGLKFRGKGPPSTAPEDTGIRSRSGFLLKIRDTRSCANEAIGYVYTALLSSDFYGQPANTNYIYFNNLPSFLQLNY
jgi:hypothetical protein